MHYLPLIYRSPTLQACFWASFWAWCCLEFWVWMRERGGTRGNNRDRGSRLWIVLWVWAGIAGGFSAMWSAPAAEIGTGARLWFSVGVVLIWLGIGLRWWAIRTLGRFFRTSVIIQGEHRMVTSGPYRWIRNPSYTGATLTMAGVGLAMLNWLSFAALLASILIAYARRITVEQRALADHFGQPYRDYIARTWALIPFVW
ncbi:MAG TPA: isoprenylcysteine carboxylmethyltransferase family protein [Terriglobales bacterium]|nr:isoprenylcysteine carboxylmethyltransferase family protein [Terriglobales bacterium]